jgi:23S rRNA (cytosine1962-C5)-methyltransferase
VARVLSRDRRLACDDALYRARALEALALRAGLDREASMYRLVNAEADGLPGLTVDRYGDYLVGQLYTEAARGLARVALEALLEAGGFRGAYLKVLPRDRRAAGDDAPGHWIAGEPGPEALIGLEHGIRLQVRPFSGLSTGIFLDQRDNRRRIAELARGRRVLNAFAYTGGFSVACAAAGATVDTLDLSAKILTWARENFEINGIDPAAHRFIAGDAFPFLSGAAGDYELVILDPPTFSTSRGNVWSPARLAELYGLGMGALRPGGWLVAFSNFAGLSEADFVESLRVAALEVRRDLRIAAVLQPGIDFPWLPGFPESRHLKGIIARV